MVRAFIVGVTLGVSVAAPIGPVNIVVLRSALSKGARPAVAVGLGAATIDALYLGISLLGAATFQVPPYFKAALSLAGSIVLGRLAYNTCRSAGSMGKIVEASGGPAMPAGLSSSGIFQAYMTGVAITVVNPVTILFWASLGSAMVSSGGNYSPLGATYAGVLAGAAGWFITIGNVWALARGRLSPVALRAVNTVCSAVLLFYSVKFLIDAYRIVLSGV